MELFKPHSNGQPVPPMKHSQPFARLMMRPRNTLPPQPRKRTYHWPAFALKWWTRMFASLVEVAFPLAYQTGHSASLRAWHQHRPAISVGCRQLWRLRTSTTV